MNVVLSLMMFVSVGFAQNFKNLDVSSMKQADIGKLPLPNEDRKYVVLKIIDGFILVGVNERDNNNNNSQKNENKFSLKTQFLLKDDDELKNSKILRGVELI